VDKIKNTCSTLPRDVAHQILRKSAGVSRSYSNNKTGDIIFKHSIVSL